MRLPDAAVEPRPAGDLLADFVMQLEIAASGPVPVQRDDTEADRAQAKGRLAPFAVYASAGRWQAARHHALLAEKLEAVERGEITRLIIAMPPRHGKSELTSFYFPTWYLGRNPHNRVIITAYGDELATVFGRRTRNLMTEIGPDVFGIRVASDSSAAGRWDIAGFDGGMVATGIGGALTGKGAHLLIIDDPFKNWEESNSPTIRQKVWDEYQATLRTRLAPGGAIIVIMTRWHEDDLVGRLLKAEKEGDGEHWEVLRLPALAEDDDPLGRAPGEPLWPERFSKVTVEATMRTLGSVKASAMYQQRPTPKGGVLFQREWFTIVDAVPAGLNRVRYWDLAATEEKDGGDPDWTAGGLVGELDGVYYVCDVRRIRARPQGVEALIKQTAELDGHRAEIWMEQEPGSSGVNTIDHYRRTVLKGYTFRGNKTTGPKELRANPLSAQAEAGNVKLLRGPWNTAFLDEIEQFPRGLHDDQVDAVSGAFQMLNSSSSLAVLKFYRDQQKQQSEEG